MRLYNIFKSFIRNEKNNKTDKNNNPFLEKEEPDNLLVKKLEFYNACYMGNIFLAQQLFQQNTDILDNDDYSTFIHTCLQGRLSISKWLLQIKPNINIASDKSHAFRGACYNGHLEVAQWLYSLNSTIDIILIEDAFIKSCSNGHLDVCQWLLQIRPDINISFNNDEAFIKACYNGHLPVCQWLRALDNSNEWYAKMIEHLV